MKKDMWENIGVEGLENVVTEPRGSRHVPLKHADCLRRFKENLARNGIVTVKEEGLLSNDLFRYIHVFDVEKSTSDAEYNFRIGFINFNTGNHAWRGVYGTKHDTGATFLTSHIPEARRYHTAGILNVVDDKIDSTSDMFKKYIIRRQSEIDYLKTVEIDDDTFARVVLALHRGKTMSNTNIGRVIELWDEPTREEWKARTAWTLHNAVAHTMSLIPDPVNRIEDMTAAINTIGEVVGIDKIAL